LQKAQYASVTGSSWFMLFWKIKNVYFEIPVVPTNAVTEETAELFLTLNQVVHIVITVLSRANFTLYIRLNSDDLYILKYVRLCPCSCMKLDIVY
jgi:hypothetical protein